MCKIYMANLIIVKNSYDTDKALENVISYVSDKEKSRGLIGAQNMLVDDALEQIYAARKFFYEKAGKKVMHFVISFAENEYISKYSLYLEGYKICKMFPKFQMMFTIHDNTGNLHIHFAIIPVNLVTGKNYILIIKLYLDFYMN